MSDVGTIITALQRQYSVPTVDPQWVRECYQALLDDGQQPTLEAVHEQYLFSDLSQSTISPVPSLIPPNPHKTLLFPRPTLLQIMSITEIGSSAFQLQTVAEQRKDILSGQTLIRRLDDDEVEEEEASASKLPAYPRGMLKFELSFGDGRLIKAIEYRRMEGIKLGETGLGAKLLVQNVKVLRGLLLLEPANTEFLGMCVDHLEADQPANFLSGLARRMGKPVPGEDPSIAHAPARPTRLPPALRNAQSITDPRPVSTRNRNTASASAGPSRPRETQTRLSFSPSKSPVKSDNDIRDGSPPLSARRPSRAASQAASARVAGMYQQTRLLAGDACEPTPTKRAREARRAALLAPQPRSEADEFDMDFDDSFLREIDVAAAAASHSSQPEQEEWNYQDDDSSFIRHVDEAEAQATAQARVSTTTSRRQTGTTSRYFDRGVTNDRTVYEVESDESSSKENRKPTDVVYISD